MVIAELDLFVLDWLSLDLKYHLVNSLFPFFSHIESKNGICNSSISQNDRHDIFNVLLCCVKPGYAAEGGRLWWEFTDSSKLMSGQVSPTLPSPLIFVSCGMLCWECSDVISNGLSGTVWLKLLIWCNEKYFRNTKDKVRSNITCFIHESYLLRLRYYHFSYTFFFLSSQT